MKLIKVNVAWLHRFECNEIWSHFWSVMSYETAAAVKWKCCRIFL